MSALILLAAGRSQRFGSDNKLLADFRGKPLALHTADAVSQCWTGERIAVVSDEAVRLLLETAGWACVKNHRPAAGQASSLRLGVKAAGAQTVVIALADMPNIDATHIDQVAVAAKEHGTAISIFNGQRMPPAGFSSDFREALVTLRGDQGARAVYERYPGAELPLDAASMRDIDRPKDLALERTP